jgi:hypothetical protein
MAVERLYSTGFYRLLQPRVTTFSNLVPFALLDVLGASLLAVWLWIALLDLTRAPATGWLAALFRIVMRSLVWGAALYLVFLLAWGLNYRRVPLRDRLRFDPGAVTGEGAVALALRAVERVNMLHDPAHSSEPLDVALVGALQRADRYVNGNGGEVVVGRPKTTVLDWYFRRATVEGMTDPFLLETLVVSDLLPFERPFVLAHEWSHLAGIADEGEANFLGWLACIHGSEIDQYSGWLFLYSQVAATLPRRERTTVAEQLAPGPRADLRASADRIARSRNPRVSAAGWQVYDRYLKANRIESGTASYSEVVRLVLGTRFDPGGMPIVRPISEAP